MDALSKIVDVLFSLGKVGIFPGTAFGISLGLVKMARVVEKGLSEAFTKYLSDLLISGNTKAIGIWVQLAPMLFNRVFGKSPLSAKFILNSVLATTFTWIVLLMLKSPSAASFWFDLSTRPSYHITIPMMYVVDWLSLVKTRYIINRLSQKYAASSVCLFFVIDLIVSYLLPELAIVMLTLILSVITFYVSPSSREYLSQTFLVFYHNFFAYISLGPLFTDYLEKYGGSIQLYDVFVPSTLFTTVWGAFFLVCIIVMQFVVILDNLRRFAAWAIRDVEKYPLVAIAKVAGALLVICSLVFSFARMI